MLCIRITWREQIVKLPIPGSRHGDSQSLVWCPITAIFQCPQGWFCCRLLASCTLRHRWKTVPIWFRLLGCLFQGGACAQHRSGQPCPMKHPSACCLHHMLQGIPAIAPRTSRFSFLWYLPHPHGFAKSLLMERLGNWQEQRDYNLEEFLRLENGLSCPWGRFTWSYFPRMVEPHKESGSELKLNSLFPWETYICFIWPGFYRLADQQPDTASFCAWRHLCLKLQ